MDIRTVSLEEMEGPLKLIHIKPDPDPCKNFTLELQSDVLKKVLSSCGNRRICVLSVVGGLRTGKTFLLNVIKAYLESIQKGEVENWMPRDQPVTGFQWSHGYNPVTKGLWVWSRAFLINDEEEELAVLLVDTEGIDEELPNNDLASTIVGLSLLCSSTTIFNLSYEFTDSTIELLEPFCKYGKTHAKKCDSPAFGKLSFLIRDWAKPSSVLSNPFSDDAGERLKRQKLSNEMHPNLSKSFTKVEFAVLPNIGEKARKIDFDGRTTQTNIDFSKRLRSYICRIANPRKLACNRIFNNDIRASQFTSLLQGYVQLFNNVRNAKDFPQQIWATAIKAAIHSKTEDGLATYEKYFPLRSPNANGEYINPDKVDGFNISAKPDAKKAFDKFKMPITESQNIEKIIDVALENHLASFKESNLKKRQAYIAQQENKTIERFRQLMLQKFDKILHKGDLQNNQYYDPEQMKLELDIFKDEALESFRQLLSQEPDDIRQKIVSNAKTKICSIMQDHIDLNQENQERAKVQADQIVIQLVSQYFQSIGDLLDKAKGQISVNVLEMLHEQKLEETKRQFQKIDFPGDSSLKEDCWNTLCIKTHNEFEKFSKLLEEAADDFDFKIQTESANHRRALVEKLDSLQDYDSEVFLTYHRELSKQIIDRLTNECSYAPNSTQRKAWLQTVTALLDNTYHDVLKGDIHTDEILRKKAKHFAEISFQKYQGEMNFYLDNFEKPVEDTEFESIHSTCQETALSEFISEIDSVNEMKIIFRNEYRDILSEDIREKYETYKQQNHQAFSIAKTNAEVAYSQCVDDLESKILRATEEVNMLDELDQAFNEAKQKAFVEFREKFPSKNEGLQNSFTQILQSKANEFYENAKLTLQSKLETFMVALKLAQNKVERFYNSEMTRNFETNRNAPFTEEQLLEIHNQVKQQAISQANNATQLNPAQQEKMEEYLENLLKTWKEKNEVNKMSYSGEPAIGIDFGTTYCCAAVYYQGKLQNIPNSNAENITASYVTLNDNGSCKCIGDISKREAYLHPSHTIYDIKRIIVRPMDDKSLKDCIKHFPFSVVGHEGVPKINVGSTMMSPESIYGMILVQIKNDAEAYLNKQVNKAVITVPPHFSDIQRQATKAAVESAGFQVLRILNEPSAAALTCVDKIDFSGSTKKVLVYDLGGGTLDVTVLEMSQRQIKVLGVNGNVQLGGDYFDRNLTMYCAGQFKAKTNIDLFKMFKSAVTTEAHDARSKFRRLLTFCEKAKCILTSATTTTITIDGFHQENDLLVEISRQKFEKLNWGLFKRTINVVNGALMSAGVKKEDIDEVILVGGSTKIPKLRQLVVEHFDGKPLHFSDNADVVVAHGAAMQAAILNTNPDQEVFNFE